MDVRLRLGVCGACALLWCALGAAASGGMGGTALKFGGVDGRVDVPHDDSFNVAAVTLEAWFWWDNTNTPAAVEFLMGKATERLEIHTGGGAGAHGLRFIPTAGVYLDTPINAFASRGWHHVAFVYDPAVPLAKGYVDGVEVPLTNRGGNPVGTAMMDSVSPFFLGQRGDNSYRLNGQLDDVRVWGTVRTQDEIKANMYRALAGNETGLVANYRMDEGAGSDLGDATANGNDGTLAGGVSWRASGSVAGPRTALAFDGTMGFVDAPPPPISGAFTAECWFLAESASRHRHLVEVGSAEHGWECAYRIHVGDEGELVAAIGDGSVFRHADVAGTGWTLDAWNHVALVYDGAAEAELFLNGRSTGAFACDLDVSGGLGRLRIGNSAVQSGRGHDGMLDEVRLWNVARTPAQLREGMTRTLAGNEPGLAAYYRMDLFDGATLYDQTTNALHGTLVDMGASPWAASTAFNAWVGAESSAWHVPANWSGNAEPVAGQAAGIRQWNALSHAPEFAGAATGAVRVLGGAAFGGEGALAGALAIEDGAVFVHGRDAATGNVVAASGALRFEDGARLTVRLENLGGASFDGEMALLGFGSVEGTPRVAFDYGATGESGFHYFASNQTLYAYRVEMAEAAGPFGGGNEVAIQGKFSAATNVLVGGIAAAFAVDPDGNLLATMPAAAAPGAVDVRIQLADGGEVLLAGAYTYLLAEQLLASEPFDYETTRWNADVALCNGGTGWGGSWQNTAGSGGTGNAIFGISGYEPHEPQVAFASGHSAYLTRPLAAPLDASPGKAYFFAADIYTPSNPPTAVYVSLGGFSIGIDSQAEKPGELILFAPDGATTWNDAKPAGLTQLYGAWHRVLGEVEFAEGGSVFRVWVDAGFDEDPSATLVTSSTGFNASSVVFAHQGHSAYALADNLVVGRRFQPTPPTVGPVAFERAPENPMLKMLDLQLLANAVDPQGAAMSVVWVSPVSTNGGTVAMSGRWILYEPPLVNPGAPDAFAFRVRSAYGGETVGLAEIRTQEPPPPSGQTLNFTATSSTSNTVLRIAGIPGRSYVVQTTTNLLETWQELGQITIGGQGYAIFTNEAAPPETQYFRTALPE